MTEDEIDLHKLLHCDASAGKLFWRTRTPEMFEDGKWTAEHKCANWNSQHAGKEAFTAKTGNGYHQSSIFGKKCYAHRVIWAMVHGDWPNVIDHINGDSSDNRIDNLRNVSQAENLKNSSRPTTNKSGVVGVSWHSPNQKWSAQIQVNGKKKHLGLFEIKAKAIAARKVAEKKYDFHTNHGKLAG